MVAALKKAGGAQHLKALVVTVGGAAGGVDLAQAALLCADRHGGAVVITGSLDRRVGQHRGGSAEPGGFVAVGAQNPAEYVQVMNQHVAEYATRGLDVLHRRRAGVAAGDDQHFGCADFTSSQTAAGVVEGGIKTALKADHAGYARGLDGFAAGNGACHRKVHRLFTEDVLAGSGGAGNQVAVGVGGRADGDGVNALVGQYGLDGGNFGTMLLCQLGSRCGYRVAHVLERHAAQGGQVGRVDATNAAGAKNCNIFHGNS